MIDTVVLTIDARDVLIQGPKRFSPSAEVIVSASPAHIGGRGNISAYQNPTKTELAQGNYKPRLTLSKRLRSGGFSTTLKIEFSAPKLLFGNNFDELEDEDFEKIIDKLDEKLLEMDILVRREVLRNAQVSAIHFSKNIVLPEFVTSSMVIRELGKIDLNQRLDLSNTDFRNEGHSLRYHANSFEITFYDKIKDLEKAKFSEKRAIEKDNAVQLDLFKDLKPRGLEVLRMEVRIGNRTKLKALLGKVAEPIEMDFKSLFQMTLSKKILLHYWEKISKDLPCFSIAPRKPEELVEAICQRGRIKPLKAAQMAGYFLLIESIGMRGFRALLGNVSNRTWQRLKKEIGTYSKFEGQKNDLMKEMRRSLVEFLPARLGLGKALNKDVIGYGYIHRRH